ncbi:MAG: choice-of-anchor J domain-containing protein [Bacteroidales bacterium]|nr:choice-of-anchor J domain-containing protein [Bacteroidales bacterium]
MKTRMLLFVFFAISFGIAKAQLPGSTCENPIFTDPINSPLVDFAINSEEYGDEYSSTNVTPSTSYLNGNDIVFQFTLTAKSYINASIAGERTGLIFTAVCPGTPAAPRLAFVGSTTGGTISNAVFEAGSYFMIASTNPAPQFTDMIISFSVEAVPVDPIITLNPTELYVGMSSPGIHDETNQLTIGNQGATDLVINDGGFAFSGPNAADFSLSLTAGDTYPLTIPFGTTKVVNITFTASSFGLANANLNITFNHPVTPTAMVPVSGMGYAPMTSFSEYFDGITPVPSGWLPDGWAKIVQSTSTSASVNVFASSTAFSLPNMARFQSSTDLQAKLYLISPAVTNLSQKRILLPARMGSSSHTGKMQVGYMTNRTDPNTFVLVTEFSVTGSFQFYSADFKNSGLTFPDVAFIGIRYVPDATNRILQIDDVKYENVPTQAVFNVNQSSFDFGTVFINETTTQLLQIYNTGTAALRIQEFDINISGSGSEAYSIIYPPGHTWPINLSFGEAINLTLQFAPTEDRSYSATLNIEDNINSEFMNVITLEGIGYDATIYPGFNYDMIGDFPPAGWRKFAGNITMGNPVPSTSANWYHGKFGNDPDLPENNSAAFRLVAIANYQWLMTPPIELGESAQDYQLKFDLAFTADNGTGPATIGAGQKFGVVVSLDGGMTWSQDNVLQWWNSSTPISNTGETVIIDLQGYSGKIILAFYAESNSIAPSGRLFVRNVGVDYSIPVANLPLETDFEEGIFPPEGWMIYDNAADLPTWEASQNQNHTMGGLTSAFHVAGAAADSWLVTPAILMPTEADIFLKFWSFNTNPAIYGKNSVWVSTGSGDPADGDFAEIWTPGSVTASWVETELNLSSYSGEIAYLAFRYEGNNAHGWYLDDISVFASAGLNLSTQELNHTTALGFPSTRQLIISNSAPANLIYSFETNYLDGPEGWLSIDPATGNVPFTQNQKHVITFDPQGLSIGSNYSATITILSNDYFNPEVIIPVTLTVTQPDNIEFTVMAGQYLNPTDISTDGDYAVLRVFQAHSGYLWSKENGLVSVTGDDPRPRGVSDGGIVAGSFNNPDVLYNGNPVQMAGRWNLATGAWTSIGMNPAVPVINYTGYHQGDGISADGQDMVGLQYLTGSTYQAYKKNETTGFEMIAAAHEGNSRATGISKNGATVFGWASLPIIPRFPVVWKNGQMITISETGGEVRAVSPDGNWATGEIGGQGFLWSESAGLSLFENTIDGTGIFCLGVTNDGLVIGAYGFSFPIEMRRAFVRYPDGTMITFNEYAFSRGLIDADEWIFYSANVATPDQQKFAGAGVNPEGQTVSFIIDFDAQIPAIQINPESLSASVSTGNTAEQQLLVTNTGSEDLEFTTFINYLPNSTAEIIKVPEGIIPEASELSLQSRSSQIMTSPDGSKSGNTFVLNYDGPNSTSIGLTGGGTFYTAVRFPSEMLAPFTGATITSVDVYINQLPTSSYLMIWGPGTTTSPGTMLQQQQLQGVASSWNTLTLTSPYLIDGNDLWIGFLHNQSAGLFPAGVDAGPAKPNGDFLSSNGSVWNRLSDYGFSANWNIRANVELGQGEWLSLNPASATVIPDATLPISATFNATGLDVGNYAANILFVTNDPYRPLITVPVNLNVFDGYCQEFAFMAGWNSFSSYIVPNTPDVEDLFAPLADDLIIMQNLTQIYWPGENVNSIGNLNNQSGYAVKLTEDVEFSVCGMNLASSQLSVNQGWSYLPVLSECEVNLSEVLGSNVSSVVIAQDLVGTQVFWPAMGINTLQTLVPGRAYKAKTTSQFGVTFPACTKNATAPATIRENSVETPWGKLNMSPLMQVVAFTNGSLIQFAEGDAIGAFGADNTVYGYMIINGNSQNQVVTLFGNDQTSSTQTGFEEGQQITWRLYRNSTAEVIDLQVDYDQTFDNTTGAFYTNSFAAITHVTLLQTGIDQFSASSVRMFPNPARDVLNFSINGANDQTIVVEIYDNKGVAVGRESFRNNTALNISHLAPGVYFVNIRTTELSETRKLVIR